MLSLEADNKNWAVDDKPPNSIFKFWCYGRDMISSNFYPYERQITALIENPWVGFEFDINISIDLKEMSEVYVL